MRLVFCFLVFSLVSLFTGCNISDSSTVEPEKFTFEFSEKPQDWTSMFSNYGVGREEEFKLTSGYRSLPAPLDTTESAFYLSGDNLSDDLNMFLKHQVNGLAPEATYRVAFNVAFATEAPSDCAGVGGGPGEAVTVHAAASEKEPKRVVDESTSRPYYRLNFVVDYEGQQNWYKASQLGDIGNSRQCEQDLMFKYKRLESRSSHWTVETDSVGRAWIYVGTRSGFEATTNLYYTEVQAVFRKE